MYGLNNGIPVSLKSIPSFGIAPQNQLTAAIQTLFWDGSEGWWYDNDDPSTMFQNSAGTTPVTAVEQFVGLQLDKSGNGNHRFQTTSGSRPRWSKRVNLLTKTEQFDDVAWAKNGGAVTANATTAPDGTLTADAFTADGTTTQHYVLQVASANANGRTISIYAKADTATFLQILTAGSANPVANYDLVNGTANMVGSNATATISPAENGWYRCVLSSPDASATNVYFTIATALNNGRFPSNSSSGTLFLWGADLRPANQATGSIPLYQRVNTSSDYDTNGFPGYLAADGSDDWMQTNSIDFSGTDKVTLCAGLRKLSDSGLGVATELSAAIASNNGTFALEAPAGASPSFNFASKGTTLVNNTAQQFISPITQTVTGIGDIAAAKNTIRVGGVDSGVNTASQGTGNYGNFPVYFFRRGGTANPFNGYEYSNIAVGKLLTTEQLASLEQYTTQKTINPDGAVYANQAGFSWNSATNPPNSTTYTGSRFITPTHEGMRRCLLLDNGTVNYYLDPNDSTKKADGTAADLTGADGQVMVEIPAFYSRRTVVGTVTTWEISSTPATGFTLHPAFTKDGVDVAFRYYGAYDACVFDNSTSTYISGLNWDNNSGAGNGVEVDVTASTGDVLASVSGIYPMVGLQRAEFRTIAANRGSGWRQVDWTLWSAVQLLYLIEYQTFFSQNILGAGNTNGSYLSPSGDQNQSPHTIAGASNSLGNISTNTTTGAGVNAKPGTSFMCYRGIENFYGNAWNWADGVIVNPDGTASANQGDWWFTNNSADFSDSVRTNMTQITNGAATASGFVSAIASSDSFFVATSTSGGSSTTYLTDQLFASTAADRGVLVGGRADDGANAGAFFVSALFVASLRNRVIGARLCW